MKTQKSNQDGVLKDATIETQRGTQSTNAENQSISDMLDSTVQTSPNFQPGQNYQNENPNVANAELVTAFADKLVKAKLAEWQKIELGDGREGIALFFPLGKWSVDELGKLVLKNNEAH